MIVINYFKQYKFPLLFLLVVIVYFFLYGPVGYDDADTGYTLALSWRIFHGEIPYRDFILVRPPLSPLFHALLLYFIPDNYQIIFDRFLFYILFAISSLFATFSLQNVFHLKEKNIDPYLLATAGFVFSVHYFQVTGWHAIDGVFFGSIGIVFLTRFESFTAIIFGILFLFLSALCKQPFYLMPFAGIVYVHFVHRKWVKTIVSSLTLLACVGILFMIFQELGILKNFLSLTIGSTKLTTLISVGFIHYIHLSTAYFIIPFIMWIVVRKFLNNKYKTFYLSVIPYFFITTLCLIPIYTLFSVLIIKRDVSNFYYLDLIGNIFFDIIIIFLLLNFIMQKNYLTLILLITLSWCSSISWSHLNPAFFSVPLIFGFLLISKEYFAVKNIKNLLMYTLFLGTITYFCALQKPYANPLRKDIIYSLDNLFPKLKNIKVGKNTYEKYHEFDALVKKYGTNFKTLPGMPLSNYLTNTNSPINIDWVFNAETGKYNNQIIKTLQDKNTIIFMEKKPAFISVTNSIEDMFNSWVTYYIKTNWQKIDSTNYFEIYKFLK